MWFICQKSQNTRTIDISFQILFFFIREGVNEKKINFLEGMSPKVWLPPPLNLFRRHKKLFFFLFFTPSLPESRREEK